MAMWLPAAAQGAAVQAGFIVAQQVDWRVRMEREAAGYVRKGYQALKRGHYKKARAWFLKAKKLFPDHKGANAGLRQVRAAEDKARRAAKKRAEAEAKKRAEAKRRAEARRKTPGQPYRLGVALALSGTGALYCRDGLDAIRLAVSEINRRGGFLGRHKIIVSARDTAARPPVAVRVVRDLIVQDKVRAVFGTYSSACAVAIKPICRQYKVLHIPAISNSENITKIHFSPWTYQVGPNSYMQAKSVVLGVADLARRLGWRRYITIASNYQWGRLTQVNVVALLKKVAPQLELIKAYWPRLGETEFRSFINAIMDQRPDFVFGALASRDNAFWLRQAKAAGFFKRIPYPGSLISVSELITRARTLPRGLVGLCRAPFFAHMDNPRMRHFVKAFRQRYGRYPSDWAVMEYDAVYILEQGIEKAGSIDNEKVRRALKGATVNTTRGRFYFRRIDNQLSCYGGYVGPVRDSPRYPFPIYIPVIKVPGPRSWRPESEIIRARSR